MDYYFRVLILAALVAACVPGRSAAQNSAETKAAPAGATSPSSLATTPSPDAKSSNFIPRGVSGYEPIYFVLGTYPAAEFQFSLKYQVFDLPDESPNPFAHLYLAYTQTSFWDVLASDPSFYDTSYKPSAFVLYNHVLPATIKNPFRLALQGGTEHESNGRGGINERSQYTVYLQTPLTFLVRDDLQLTLQPRFWDYYDLGNNNKNLAQYRGYGNLLASVTWKISSTHETIQFWTKLQAGTGFRHPGRQYGLRFNLPAWLYFRPTIQVQYFTGYGQTLIQYNRSSRAIRAGLCLWYPELGWQ